MGKCRSSIHNCCCLLLALCMLLTFFSPLASASQLPEKTYESTLQEKDNPFSSTGRTFHSLFRQCLTTLRGTQREGIFFNLVTNHNGTETAARLRSFLPTSIDIDEDGDKDIRVWVIRRPAIQLLPPSVGLKTSLLVRRLPGLDESQIDDALEVYLEYAPKVLTTITDVPLDRIRIGYQSPEGETIPSLCVLSQTTYFHTIHPRRQPTHIFSIHPGAIAGHHQLNFIAALADTEGNDIITEHRLTVACDPVSNTELTLTRSHANKDLAIALETAHSLDATIWYTKHELGIETTFGLSIENLSSFRCELSAARAYQKTSRIDYRCLTNEPTKVTLFVQNSNDVYLYLKYLPPHISLTWLPENNGWLEVNTSADAVEQVGFCNDLLHPTFNVYVNNISANGKVTWNLSSLDRLDAGCLSITSTEAISTVHLDAITGHTGSTTVSLDIESKPRIDATLSWNIAQEYLCIEQSRMDLSISVLFTNNKGNTFAGSCAYQPREHSSLTLSFAALFTDDVSFGLSGSSFILQNMSMFFTIQGLGNLTIFMDQVVKRNPGAINLSIQGMQNGDSVLCNCSLEVTGGVEITNLSIGYNGAWHNASSVVVEDHDTLFFMLSATLDISYEFADDFSWGYISFSGSLYMNLNVVLNWNGTQGGLKGEITLKSLYDAFVISWKTIDEKRYFTLNGTSLVSLSDFHAWFDEIFDIDIPQLHGSFVLKNASKQQGFFSLTFQGSGLLSLNTSFSSENESNTTILLSLSTEIMSGDPPATVAVGWDQHNITGIELDVLDGGHLVVHNCSLVVIEDSNVSLHIENLTASFTGYFLRMVLPTNSSNTTMRSTLKDAEISLHIDTINLSSSELDLGEFIFISQVQGTATFSLVNYTNESCLNKTAVEELMWHNFTIDIDASTSHFILDTLYIEHLANYSTVEMHNLSIQNGSTRLILHAAVNQNVTAARFIYASFNNSPHTMMFLNSFSFDLVLQDIPPLPTALYSGVLVDGLFEVHLRLFDIIAVTIFNGSAIDHLGVNVTPPEGAGLPEFYLHTFFEEPVDYLTVGFNIFPADHLFIDTHNTTTYLNMSLMFPTLSGEIIGYRFDDILLKADRFFLHMPNVYWDPANVSIDEFYIEGYLHIEGEGTLWMLLNGMWQPLYPYTGTLIIRPGHLTVNVTGEIALDYTTILPTGDEVTLIGTFTAAHCFMDLWWNTTTHTTELRFTGSLVIDDFLFTVSYGHRAGEFSSLSWSSLTLVDAAHILLRNDDGSPVMIHCSAEYLDISGLHIENTSQMFTVHSLYASGKINLSMVPSDTFDYIGINVSYLSGIFELDDIAASFPGLDNLDHLCFNGSGDINITYWINQENDQTLTLETQNGLLIDSFIITFDDPSHYFKIKRGSTQGMIQEGFFTASWNIDGDGDGFIFLDSSYLVLDGVQIVVMRDGFFDWGIRLSFPDGYIDADERKVEWDPLLYIRFLGIYIPYNFQFSGSITGDIDVDITDSGGDTWYDLYPYNNNNQIQSNPVPYLQTISFLQRTSFLNKTFAHPTDT
ncbi:MAG: hypothetical protein JW771_02200 [Candidatus Thermoplasmatota archaeon]|nr:hypothetical protein [Candidatus Thermoplasmatota archaeon]